MGLSHETSSSNLPLARLAIPLSSVELPDRGHSGDLGWPIPSFTFSPFLEWLLFRTYYVPVWCPTFGTEMGKAPSLFPGGQRCASNCMRVQVMIQGALGA